MSSGSLSQRSSQRGFSEQVCSVLATLSQASERLLLVGRDEEATEGALPEGITREGRELIVDLASFPGLARSGHSLWVADAEVIIVHGSDGFEYRAYSSDCPHHRSGESIFEAEDGDASHDQCPSFRSVVGGDGAPAEEENTTLTQFPLTQEGDKLRIALS